MKAIFDFIHAALPWIAIGLLIAVFAVRSAAEKTRDENADADYGTEGMCLGMCMGTAIENTGIGICLGMVVGLAIGSLIKKHNSD